MNATLPIVDPYTSVTLLESKLPYYPCIADARAGEPVGYGAGPGAVPGP